LNKCQNWEQNCHIVPNNIAKDCADARGVTCPNLDGWKHYPESPWGDIDICPHGCTRPHGSTEKECRFCDF